MARTTFLTVTSERQAVSEESPQHVEQASTPQRGASMPWRFPVLTLALAFLPLFGSAQTSNHVQPAAGFSDGAPAGREARNTVSVRELSIPEKARKSFEKGVRLL